LSETGAYITARVAVAGGVAAQLFTREAVITIHERSQGIPRVISVLCHNALISAFALGRKPVATDIVLEVCRDFDLSKIGPIEKSTVFLDPQLAVDRRSVPRTPKASAPAAKGRATDMFSDIQKSRRWYSFF
jgi:general secretion pathway protein A